MMVLVDTSVWSLALRRQNVPSDPYVQELNDLITEFRAQIIGPVRQEILSGIRVPVQFEKLRDHLRAFPDLELLTEDYERAAEFLNMCRSKGIQGSNTDFLISAVADRYNIPILTTDKDFALYQQHLPVKLHIPRTLV
jgi:hypothetical protein